MQDHIPILIGGNGTRVLQFAAQHGDIVGITGLGRTLADGHLHEVDWSPGGIRRIVDLVRVAEGPNGAGPQIDALVQHVEITDDAEAAAARLAEHIPGASADDLLAAPFVWLGTFEEIRAGLRDHREMLGIERYTVRGPTLADVRRVLNGMG